MIQKQYMSVLIFFGIFAVSNVSYSLSLKPLSQREYEIVVAEPMSMTIPMKKALPEEELVENESLLEVSEDVSDKPENESEGQ